MTTISSIQTFFQPTKSDSYIKRILTFIVLLPFLALKLPSLLSYIRELLEPEPESYVKQIFIHPVKSLAPVSLEECDVDEHGFKNDRKYMVCEPDKKNLNDPKAYRFLTQREVPQFTLIEPEVEDNSLILRYPPKNISLTLPLNLSDKMEQEAQRVNVFIWGETPQSIDIGSLYPEVEKFFNQVRGIGDSKTTIVAPDTRRHVVKGTPASQIGRKDPQSSFQDYFPGNLICQHSLDDLNSKVETKTNGKVHLTPRNFRPNMVIANTAKPWDEDDWKRVKIGNHSWYVPCRNVRCRVTTVNTGKGAFEPTSEPLKTMQSFRRIDAGAKYSPCMGMNLVNDDVGYRVKVGDQFRVLKRGDHFYPPGLA